MAGLIRDFDWAGTPVGPAASWPRSLRTAVHIALSSRYPMFVWWGKDLINIYNDAYTPFLGKRHPWALGRPAAEVWYELWDLLGPQTDLILRGGEASRHDRRLLIMERNGFTEETYFTFSHSPILDDDGGIGGVFGACTDDTPQVLSQRRLKILRQLGVSTAGEAWTAESACRAAAGTLVGNPNDLPFALLYLLDEGGTRAHLAGATRLEPGTRASPLVVDLADGAAPWPLGAVVATGEAQAVDELPARLGPLPGGAWPESPQRALVLPLAELGQTCPTGLLVAGLSPRLPFDDDYQAFLDLTASHIASAIAGARAYEAARRRAEALAELDRAKTVFFSNVSHELRTPLTLVLGPIEECLARAEDPGQRERIELVQRNARRLQKLVNALLDFARIEAGRMQASYQPTELCVATGDLASAFRSAVERAGLRFVVDCPPLPEPVYVDRDMWEKIVLNLVSNAFKFTFAGEIRVRLVPDDGAVRLIVQDSGVGIAGEHLPHIFERFYRIAEARGRTHEGTGIGLALVRELVRLHGGTVSVESALGRGTTFIVSIPTGTAHLPRDAVRAPSVSVAKLAGAAAFVEEASGWLDTEAGAPPPGQGGGEAPSASDAAGYHVLVADDNADMRAYLARILRPLGTVETVTDGVQALAAARRHPPDLVLTDTMMPNLDGFGLLRALRDDDVLKTLPIVILSARAGEEALVDGMSAGADDYLVKPFSARELFARVRSLLALSRERRHAAAALRESEERFRTMANGTSLILWMIDAEGAIVFVNDAYLEFFGTTYEAVRSGAWRPQLHPDDQAAYVEAFMTAVREGKNFRGQCRVRRGDGQWRWTETHGRPRFSTTGQVIGMTGSKMDITHVKEAEEERREVDRRKDHFLAVLSHELRNPLTPIRNSLYLLEQAPAGSERARTAKATIDRQVGLLSRLVDDLLDVTRITRGKIQLQRHPLDLNELVRRTVEDHRSIFDAAAMRLELALAPGQVRVDADWNRLAQVIGNLLQNAAKFAGRGQTTRVTVSRDAGKRQAVISVADTGVGMAAPTLAQLFRPFVQADETLERSKGGLGLGLTLVEGLVTLHGGTVTAHSDGLGHGSEIVVRLPLVDGDELAVERRSPGPPSPRRRVLIIEDNRDAAASLRSVLELWGHEVAVAFTGPDGLAKARELRPEVILCDIGLPQMDGYAVARAIRGDASIDRTVLVALSGYALPEDVRRATSAGFERHLAKPPSVEKLKELMASLPS